MSERPLQGTTLTDTERFSTWEGGKLRQHPDELRLIQESRKFTPLTVQLALCEACESDCPFCSVAGRPLKSSMPFDTLNKCLEDFRSLGAKSVEITGGGNPMLYRDRESVKDINDVIQVASDLGLDVGIITNSHDLRKLKPELFDKINWVRISLIKLDEGKAPEDYNFNGFPETKLGFSYIIYETGGVPDELSRTGRVYEGTTPDTIHRIAKLVELHPGIKFVRIAGDCLIPGNNALVRDQWKDVIDAVDQYGKFFIKDIGNDDSPFNDGCYVGMIRPYVAPDPSGEGYNVYICTSHVLFKRTYDPAYALCSVEEIIPKWQEMNERFEQEGIPYEVNGNGGHDWCKTCQLCYYKGNNRFLHNIANGMPIPDPDPDMPDKNFP